jgi:hypothetical protein
MTALLEARVGSGKQLLATRGNRLELVDEADRQDDLADLIGSADQSKRTPARTATTRKENAERRSEPLLWIEAQ